MRFIHQTMLCAALLGLSGEASLASTRNQLAEFDNASVLAENHAPLPLPAEDAATGTETPPEDTSEEPPPPEGEQPEFSEDDFNLGEIPDIKSVELTVDMAKRALDTWLMVSEKYKDADLEAYDDLQEFVDKNEQGYAFETDIKSAGFVSVAEWNVAITSLSFAYSGVLDDPTAEIHAQIEEIKADDTLAQDLRDRMIASLSAMIPSENNKKVVQELLADPIYKEKLEQLEGGSDEEELE